MPAHVISINDLITDSFTDTPGSETFPGQFGSVGTYNSAGYLDFIEYNPELQREMFRGDFWNAGVLHRMLNDSQVNATILAHNLTFKSAKWTIQPGAQGEKFKEHADFARENYMVRGNWSNFLEHMLLFLPYGFMVFEKFFYNGDFRNSRRTFQSLEPRLPRTIEQWLVKDDRLETIVQRTDRGIHRIPADKCVVFTHRREGNNYEGKSALRPAYKNWKMKNHYQKLQAIAFEKGACPVMHIKAPRNADKKDIAAMRNFARKFKANEELFVVSQNKNGADGQEGWEIEFIRMEDIVLDVSSGISHHDQQIGANLLLGFGSMGETGDRGSHALFQGKKDFFLVGIQAHANDVVDVFNNGIQFEFPAPVRELIDMNFGPQEFYPKLAVSNLAAKNVEHILKSVEALTAAIQGGLPDNQINHIASLLEFPQFEPGTILRPLPAAIELSKGNVNDAIVTLETYIETVRKAA